MQTPAQSTAIQTITVTLSQELTLVRVQRALLEQRRAQMVQQTSTLLQAELWKVSTANQRFELIVKVAASIGKSPQETLSLAFSVVHRKGPFPRLAAQKLKAFSLSTSRHGAAMSGGDKAEHIVANAYLVMAGLKSGSTALAFLNFATNDLFVPVSD